MAHHHHHRATSFHFPKLNSAVLPDTSPFFAWELLSSPLPTNSFFQNFVLNNGDQPELIHPYLIRSSDASLSLCYPLRVVSPHCIYQAFSSDLTISSAAAPTGSAHVVSDFDDLSVTLDLPPALRFFLVRGSPFVTCSTTPDDAAAPIFISTDHTILSVTHNPARTKHTIHLNNGQTFAVYSSSPLHLSQPSASQIQTFADFAGVLRFAYVPNPSYDPVLDRFSGCYPVSGGAAFAGPFCVEYRWGKRGPGDLLLLSNPLQLRLLSHGEGSGVKEVLPRFKYDSMDGKLVGVVGDSWLLKTDPIRITWHSMGGVEEAAREEVVAALRQDVDELTSMPINTTSSYFYGKAIARAARLALIAKEVGFPDVIPAVESFLKGAITPWLNGSFQGNGFLYEPKWGGIVTKQGLWDSLADFGFGVYNGHHYHLGYFIYAIAVLAKLDPAWGRSYMLQAYSILGDFMTLSKNTEQSSYTRLRNFDLWKLHSWGDGITKFANGRHQKSTSEAVNAYYSAALMGLSYGDVELVAVSSTLAALEVQAAVTWWHVREGEGMYEEDFSRENRLVGELYTNMRFSGLWFDPPEGKECTLGWQLLPLLPITEVLFGDAAFARALVEWALPALAMEGVGEGWKGFVYALEGVYDKATALAKTREMVGFDDGNSLSNMLWWLHSR